MSRFIRHAIAIVAVSALVAPAILDGCLMSCHAAGAAQSSMPPCHVTQPVPGGGISSDQSACTHGQGSAVVENAYYRFAGGSSRPLPVVVGGEQHVQISPVRVECCRVTPSYSRGIHIAAFVLPLRI